MTPTRAAWCCSTLRGTTGGRPCCRSAARSSAASTGGRRWRRTLAACWPARWPGGVRFRRSRPRTRPVPVRRRGHHHSPNGPGGSPEIWCRCDGGPHGFLSIAAHAHADALSVEVRCDGVDILADPGTYCYHGEPEWRTYFRSTIGHNTVEIGGQWQSTRGGAFLWLRHATGQEISVTGLDGGDIASWTAVHNGYRTLKPSASHRRSVRLERGAATIEITDQVLGDDHDIRLAFHLGPDVQAELSGARAALTWPGASGPASAVLELPGELSWTLHRGEVAPILGWYSAGLGHRVPAFTFLGHGRCASDMRLITLLRFARTEKLGGLRGSGQAVSLGASTAALTMAQEDDAEAL